MLICFSYLIDIKDRRFDQVATEVREHAKHLAPLHPVLRGVTVAQHGSLLRINLRVAGHNRWNVGRDAPRILNAFLRKIKIPVADVTFEQALSEKNGRSALAGQGRTESPRRSRAELRGRANPWDHIEWVGDE